MTQQKVGLTVARANFSWTIVVFSWTLVVQKLLWKPTKIGSVASVERRIFLQKGGMLVSAVMLLKMKTTNRKT